MQRGLCIHHHLVWADVLELGQLVGCLPFIEGWLLLGVASVRVTVNSGQCVKTRDTVWWLVQRGLCRRDCGSCQGFPERAMESEIT